MSEVQNQKRRSQLWRGFLYALCYATYIASYLGIIGALFFLMLLANRTDYMLLVSTIVYLLLPLTIIGVMLSYSIAVFLGSRSSAGVAVLVFVYFIYYSWTNNLGSTGATINNNIQNGALLIIWFLITILIGRRIYDRQASPIKAIYKKTINKGKNVRFKPSYFRRLFPAYLNAIRNNQRTVKSKLEIQNSKIFFIFLLCLALGTIVSIATESGVEIILAFISAVILYALIQGSVISDYTYFPITSFLLLIDFFILSLYVAPFLVHTRIWLYMNGIIISADIVVIIVVLIFLSFLYYKEIKNVSSLKKEVKDISSGIKQLDYISQIDRRDIIYKKYYKSVARKRLYFSVIFPVVVFLLIFSSISFDVNLAQPNVSISSSSGLTEIGVSINQPFGGFIFYEPHGAKFTLEIDFNVSNTVYNRINPITICNVSLYNGETPYLKVLNYSSSTLPIGVTKMDVNFLVSGSYFSGVVDMRVIIQN